MTYKILSATAVALICVEYGKAAAVEFEFNIAGTLPSQQGAQYVGTVPETNAFSVSGGFLRQDTLPFGTDTANYRVPDIFDVSDVAPGGTLEWRARVVQSSLFGIEIGLLSPNRIFDFFLANSVVYYHNGSVIVPAFDLDTTQFHVYRLVIPQGSPTFDLYVDDILRFSAAAPQFNGTNILVWGDSTLSGGNGSAEWDYIRFNEVVVPEPISSVLVGSALTGFLLRSRRRQAARMSGPRQTV